MEYMNKTWAPEIEKKYRLIGKDQAEELMRCALKEGLQEESWTLQRDLVPDFLGGVMKKAGVLLRVRKIEYLKGIGPGWALTLKVKKVEAGIHKNQELEATSLNTEKLIAIEDFISRHFGISVDMLQLVTLDPLYMQSIGLIEHRMYIEKRRHEYKDMHNEITLAVDELPSPLGWFAEIELGEATVFEEWESKLQLAEASVESNDYGQLVKEARKDMDQSSQRTLSFEDMV